MNSDNFYYKNKCPAVMEDGRIYTSYLPDSTLVDAIKRANHIETHLDYSPYNNNDFRLFMQRNAVKLITQDRDYWYNYYTCKFPRIPRIVRYDMPYKRY